VRASIRLRAAAFAAATGLLLTAGPALALTTSIAPPSQTHAHGVASSWSLHWGGIPPYHVQFAFGDGFGIIIENTTTTSSGPVYTFYPCTTRTFHQTLTVFDGWNEANHTYLNVQQSTSTSQEGGGPC
jgi:hypothetical protein